MWNLIRVGACFSLVVFWMETNKITYQYQQDRSHHRYRFAAMFCIPPAEVCTQCYCQSRIIDPMLPGMESVGEIPAVAVTIPPFEPLALAHCAQFVVLAEHMLQSADRSHLDDG